MIHVLQSGNDYVYKGVCLNVLTMLKYTKEPFHLHLMTAEVSWHNSHKISYEDYEFLRNYVKSVNPDCEVSYYDVSNDLENTFKGTPNQNPEYTPFTLIRLFADKYIDCDKLIYLDCDIMTCNSLSEFSKIDINDYEIAVCKDYMGRFWVKYDYINAGVLYFNLKKCRETHMFEKCIDLLRRKRYFFSDQTAIYKSAKLRKYIPFRFNEQRDIKPDTVVKHFCKGIRYIPFFKIYNVKQWDVNKVHSFLKMNFFDDIYEQYSKIFTKYPL